MRLQKDTSLSRATKDMQGFPPLVVDVPGTTQDPGVVAAIAVGRLPGAATEEAALAAEPPRARKARF